MKQITELVDRQMREWEMRRERPHPQSKRGPVICVSRDLGAGGRSVAIKLAEKLGLDLMGKDIIDSIAEDLHQQRRMVDILDERGKETLERWVDGYLHGAPIEYDEYAKALIKVIRASAIHGNILFLGRGANWVLGVEEAFCIRIVAPLERRVKQVMEYHSASKEEAAQMIRETDAQRTEFVKKVFHRDHNDPSAYHLTLNCGVFSDEQAIEIIRKAMTIHGVLNDETPMSA